VRKLSQNAVDARRWAVAALQVALIRGARESSGKRRRLPDGDEYLLRGGLLGIRGRLLGLHAASAGATGKQGRGQ
jgi:hypothetical protein